MKNVLAAALNVVVAAVAIVGASACGAPAGDYAIKTVFDPCEPVVLVADNDATDAERASIAAGLAMWNDLAGAHYADADADAAADADADGAGADVADVPRIPVHFDAAGANFHGFYDDNKAEIFVNDDFADDHARSITIAHEVGHTLGLLHVPAEKRSSVMISGNMNVAPNAGDLNALQALWGDCRANADDSTK